MDILSKARRLEAALSGTLDRAAQRVRRTGPREPLEIAHAIVDAVAEQVQPAGRGGYVFPFNRVKVLLAPATKAERARLEAVLDGAVSLRDRVIERLESAGCAGSDVDIKTAYVPAAGHDWTNDAFHLELLRVADRAQLSATASGPATLKLTVEHGTASRSAYSFTARRVDLGRCDEVRDSHGRLIRSNHVAFADGANDANHGVSRRHAHIDYDPADGHYRVCDDGSAHGTRVLRGGRPITVPAGARGIRLQSGDVIVLGEARVRVTLQNP